MSLEEGVGVVVVVVVLSVVPSTLSACEFVVCLFWLLGQ